MKKLLLIAAGVVVLYFVWERYGKKTPSVTKPLIIPSKDYTQGDLMNERAAASGNMTAALSSPDRPCYCNGEYLGNMSSGQCSRHCKKKVKKGW